mmetsp:Transcript_8499/g.20051  ORF Transcript_8499/g.20051 Transcript_8499/m.20051 type:complete len:262 (+) Transcript_8499:352-1137(+)
MLRLPAPQLRQGWSGRACGQARGSAGAHLGGHEGLQAVRGHAGQAARPPHPRRRCQAHRSWLQGGELEHGGQGGGHRQRQGQPLRRPVSSGGRPHGEGHGDVQQLPLQHRGPVAHVHPEEPPSGCPRRDPRDCGPEGGAGAGVWGCGLVCVCGALQGGPRGEASARGARGPRLHAQERERTRRTGARSPGDRAAHGAGREGVRRGVHLGQGQDRWAARQDDLTRGKADDHRRHVHADHGLGDRGPQNQPRQRVPGPGHAAP